MAANPTPKSGRHHAGAKELAKAYTPGELRIVSEIVSECARRMRPRR